MADGRVGRLGHQGPQALFGGRVLRVVEAKDGERAFECLNVLLGLGDARLVDLVDDIRHDHRGEQADDDDDDHDFDQGEASRAPCGGTQPMR